jgi:hydroxyethylthiazole kinase-like uncharacterized protein yjeF
MHHWSLPGALYSVNAVRGIDRYAIDDMAMGGYRLMMRAARALEGLLVDCFESRFRAGAGRLIVYCGAGNNAGDGYAVAGLAHRRGWPVEVVPVVPPDSLRGDALRAFKDAREAGVRVFEVGDWPDLQPSDVCLDALLGTGLDRPVSGRFLEAIGRVNAAGCTVVSADVPSGINAGTGACMGSAIRADMTMTFIAMKSGLLTGDAPEYTGTLMLDDLGVPAEAFSRQTVQCLRLGWPDVMPMLPTRSAASHKGSFGHLLLLGGNEGMLGALMLAASGASRTGCGLVSARSLSDQAGLITLAQPNVMAARWTDASVLDGKTAVVAGMGMGTDDRAATCLGKVMDSGCPCVLDADALNLIAGMDVSFFGTEAVLTPHPGEAARLLNVKTADVQANRFEALDALVARYGAVVVLKGAGSLIGAPGHKTRLCSAGNPGMAVGGMGDVLSGVIGALMANGLSAFDAACAGVTVHAEAADLLVAEKGVLGLLPQDMGEAIRAVMNGRLGVKGV